MFLTSCGLLLRDDLHHAFDRQVWSLYYKVSRATPPAVLVMWGHSLLILTICRTAPSTFIFLFLHFRTRPGCTALRFLWTAFVVRPQKGQISDWSDGTTTNA